MRKIILLVLLSLTINAQSSLPELLSYYNYTEQIIPTEDGQEFIAWILEDDEARRLNEVVRKLELVEKDETDDLIFRTYSDGNYEYVLSKNKWKAREAPFFRITVYSIL